MRLVLALAMLATPLLAQEEVPAPVVAQPPSAALTLPGNATLTAEIAEPVARYPLPTGPFADGALPVRPLDGALLQQSWHIDAADLAVSQIMRPLRDQLLAQGFAVLLDCETDTCGGYDFRFATDVLPPPAMYVDLGDFRFLSARHPVTGEAVGLFVSRSPFAGFVQIVRVTPAGVGAPAAADPVGAPVAPVGDPAAGAAVVPADLAATLDRQGHVVLDDLAFGSGASDLGPGPFASLDALAAWLATDPARRVALVGHTDATGPLEVNIAISRQRAAAVARRLVTGYGAAPGQLDAQGIGYLAPRATNLTPAGREANRRVEAVVVGEQ